MSSRPRFALAALLAAGLILVAMLAGSASGRASKTVEVGDDFFSPSSLSISKGTKVKFNWTGSDKHDVIKKRGPGRAFGSGATDADGVNFTHKFKKAGTYKIICTLHEKMKMTIGVS